MAARKAVFTLSVSATGFTAPIISAPPYGGTSANEIKIGAFGDKSFTNLVSEIMQYNNIPVVLLDEGSGLMPLPCTQHDITIAAGYSDGSVTTVTRSVTKKMNVVSVEPSTIEVDGNRRNAVTVTLSPVGGDEADSAAVYGSTAD